MIKTTAATATEARKMSLDDTKCSVITSISCLPLCTIWNEFAKRSIKKSVCPIANSVRSRSLLMMWTNLKIARIKPSPSNRKIHRLSHCRWYVRCACAYRRVAVIAAIVVVTINRNQIIQLKLLVSAALSSVWLFLSPSIYTSLSHSHIPAPVAHCNPYKQRSVGRADTMIFLFYKLPLWRRHTLILFRACYAYIRFDHDWMRLFKKKKQKQTNTHPVVVHRPN